MYINKIDELIDRVIDDFYNDNIENNKFFIKLQGEINFVKHQKTINKMIDNYSKKINVTEIKTLINKQENINKILNTIKRYVAYYIFLMIGYNYSGKKESYINNIIEYSTSQTDMSFKIDNFFNSENNAAIIKYYQLVKDIIYIINLENLKGINLSKHKTSLNFLNQFGKEYIDENFKGNNLTKAHNLVKTIIFFELYNKQEKKEIFRILNEIEKEEGEFRYIEIVVSKKKFIDYSSIENLLTPENNRKGLASKLYDFLNDYLDGNYSEKLLTMDEKIEKLLNNNTIVPIVDDFLRYHKDTEKSDYDKNDGKSKKNTKIKYVVTKIDNVSELYSENAKKNKQVKKNIEKKFSAPLSHRKAILINDTEEIAIINKIHNQGLKSIKENEYYSDLVNYRLYPYSNFKDFQKYGFKLLIKNKTIDLVRYSTFQFKKANEKSSSNNSLQLRIGSKNMNIDIVGFMINASTEPKECQQLSKIKNIRHQKFKIKDKKTQIDNGYRATLTLLKNMFFKKKKINRSLYWIFDLEKDLIKMDTYNEISNVNKNESIKLIMSKLYDELINNMYNTIIYNISKKKNIYAHYLLKFLEKYQNKLFKLDKNSDEYKKIIAIIMNKKYINVDTGYDYNEDKIPGRDGKIIKLPSLPSGKKDNDIVYIKLSKKKKINKTEQMYLTNDAVCQHNLSWIQISAKKRTNPTEFNEELFAFIEKYLTENKEHDFVCKSCGLMLPIKKYIQGGVYDTKQGKFITFNMPLEIPLENIKEYEKYSKSIKNIDKLIEKICTIADIALYVGSESSTRIKRKELTKTVIDLVILHNKTLKKNNFKKRNEQADKNYGINRNLSNLFFFDFDNSIFTYSSKDTDKYKIIKFNNIVVYIIIALILELNDNHIVDLKNDKFCNMYLFQKIGPKLFNNLKIIQNTGTDTKNINDYNILSFVVYYFSCLLARFKIWNYDYGENKKKSLPLVQMMSIHTIIDMLNSILEVDINKITNKNYIYKMFTTKFYIKLESTYKNDDIMKRLINQKQQVRKFNPKGKGKGINIDNISAKEISGVMTDYDGKYMDYTFPKLCKNQLYSAPSREDTRTTYNKLSSITNCNTGNFHKWSVDGVKLKCDICSVVHGEETNVNTKKIENVYKKMMLGKIANNYCGLNKNNTNNVCDICDKKECSNLPFEDLTKIYKKIRQSKKALYNKESQIYVNLDESKKRKFEKYQNIANNVIKKFSSIDKFDYIDKFIENIHSVIGKNININNDNIYTKYDVYIIDHDRYGNSLKNNIIFRENDNIIRTKLNHDFFKTDVIYYTNRKEGDVQIFYNKITKLYLGYREPNKEYVKSSNKNIYIKINYSIYNRLLQLGYDTKFINIGEQVDELSKYYDKTKEEEQIINNIVGKISRNRIKRLKKIITDVHRSLYQLKFKFEISNSFDKINEIIKKFKQKLGNIKINGDQRVFKHWKAITSEIYYKKADVININTEFKYIEINDITKHDNSGNLLLFYLIQEMNNLIDINTEKFVKVNIVYFLINIINHSHNLYNTDTKNNNIRLSRFKYMLSSESYMVDAMKEEYGGHGIYNEYMDNDELTNEDRLERLDIDNERLDALDIDTGHDDNDDGSEYNYEDEQMHSPEYV